jgi:geranylgeranyl diphosphate synthase type II
MRSLGTYCGMVEEALPSMLPPAVGYGAKATEAARYSLLLGGKRLRPALLLAACEGVGGDAREALHAACALECIHTYSLIHDDLPAMDDDDLRRGKPACHKQYGEDMAILAGDGLNTHAFWLIAEGARKAGRHYDRHLRALSAIASAAGFYGMVTGQAADVTLSRDTAGDDALAFIHANKTAALFRAAMVAGAEIGGADAETVGALADYGQHLGLAFQAADDVLDATSTPEQLGKTPGKDERAGKLTIVTLHGLEAAKERGYTETDRAIEAVASLGEARYFVDLANALVDRER